LTFNELSCLAEILAMTGEKFSASLSVLQSKTGLHIICTEYFLKKGGYMANIMKSKNFNGDGNGSVTRSLMPFGGLVDSVFGNTWSRFFDDDLWGFASNQVPVNIKETGKTYEMEVVAPGLKKEDFHVSINDNMLTVSFDHKEENKEENKSEGYLRLEYSRQSFARSFSLDDTADAEKIKARYSDGVLHLSIPKKEGAQRITKNIEIK
jgi:HSP20 family protein